MMKRFLPILVKRLHATQAANSRRLWEALTWLRRAPDPFVPQLYRVDQVRRELPIP
jgi:hypothetical protein